LSRKEGVRLGLPHRRPSRQHPAVLLAGGKLPLLPGGLVVRFPKDRACRALGLMSAKSDDSFVDRNQFPHESFRDKLECGKRRMPEPKLPEGDISPAALLVKTYMAPRKIITSGFSFSGSSAVVDLLTDHDGVVEFPGFETRPFNGFAAFAGLIKSIRTGGVVTDEALRLSLELIRGKSVGESSFQEHAVRSVETMREAFGSLFDDAVNQFENAIKAEPSRRQTVVMAATKLINTLCEDYAKKTGAHTIVLDQAVRPWTLNRAKFFGRASIIVVRRDLRDQILERLRHGFPDLGFVAEMQKRVEAMKIQSQALPEGTTLSEYWFEDIVLDRAVRESLVASTGVNPASRISKKFNPVASVRNVNLHVQHGDLADKIKGVEPHMMYHDASAGTRARKLLDDFKEFYAEAAINKAGSLESTLSFGDAPPLSD